MTSAQSMQGRSDGATERRSEEGYVSPRFDAHFGVIVLLILLIAGCGQRLEQPSMVTAPYAQPRLWAVAPFANESGISEIDVYRVADLFAGEVQWVHGINTIPVNRVIRAMRELEMHSISTVDDARLLMNVLGVDGIVVGTVSEYDAYPPLGLGLAVELHVNERGDPMHRFDPRDLSRSPSGEPSPGMMDQSAPVAQAAGMFDAANHHTLAQLRAYARGRSVPESAYGKDIYLVSMDRYTQFASHRLVLDLLASEQQRVQPVAEEEQLTSR